MNNKKIDLILEHIRNNTIQFLQTYKIDDLDLDALSISITLHIDRTNTSRILNILWRENKLIKIQGRPVYFLDYSIIHKQNPSIIIPTLIPNEQDILDYIESSHFTNEPSLLVSSKIDPLNELIGSNGSLSDQIVLAKSAIDYPPIGLHTLIIGEKGTGKSIFTSAMFHYAIFHGIRDSKCKYTIVYCRDFENDPIKFQELLVGASNINVFTKQNKSLLSSYNNGFIIFEDINYLSNASIDLLCSIISHKSFVSFEFNSPETLNTMFIATSSQEPNDKLIQLYNYFPIVIKLPSLKQRGLFETLELILYLLSDEAKTIKNSIVVSKDIIVLLLSQEYNNNISELKNLIKNLCSKAFLNAELSHQDVIRISYNNLSNDILNKPNNANVGKLSAVNLLSFINGDYITFDKNGRSKETESLYSLSAEYSHNRYSQFLDEFNVNADELENIDDYVSKNINSLATCPEPQLSLMRKSIQPTIFNVFVSVLSKSHEYSVLLDNIQLLYGILIHVEHLLERVKSNNLSKNVSYSIVKEIYSDAFEIAKSIYFEIAKTYGIDFETITNREIDFLTSYLVISKQIVKKSKIGILVICHGNHIASDLVKLISLTIKENYYIDFIDYKDNMQFNDCLELACIKAKSINQGSGVLIACDIPPLTTIDKYIIKNTGIPSKCIQDITLSKLVKLVYKTINNINDLNTLVYQTTYTKNQTNDADSDLLQNVADRVITKSVTFIDVNKTICLLKPCLSDILTKLSISYSDELAVKFYIHTVNMIERVIKKEVWNYNHLKLFIHNNEKLFMIINNSFQSINLNYDISIPLCEIAYVTEIFLANS